MFCYAENAGDATPTRMGPEDCQVLKFVGLF